MCQTKIELFIFMQGNWQTIIIISPVLAKKSMTKNEKYLHFIPEKKLNVKSFL